MKLPATALAETQDKILARTDYTPNEAHNYLNQLDYYKPFLATQPESNLQVRQRCLIKGLLHIIGSPISTGHEIDLSPLVSNGRWIEGPCYCDYVLLACGWLRQVSGYTITAQTVIDTYQAIIAPDGSIPLPEARDVKWTQFKEAADYVSTPAYICKRWSSGAYLLVAIDPEMPVRGNLHCHPECGYFAFGATDNSEGFEPLGITADGKFVYQNIRNGNVCFLASSNHNELSLYGLVPDSAFWKQYSGSNDPSWRFVARKMMTSCISIGQYKALAGDLTPYSRTKRFVWKARCRPYEGFDFHNIIGDDGLLAMLPPNAVLPTWRIKPPRITVKRLMQGVEIRWANGGWWDSKRTITWGDGKVVVTDRWNGIRKRVVGEWVV